MKCPEVADEEWGHMSPRHIARSPFCFGRPHPFSFAKRAHDVLCHLADVAAAEAAGAAKVDALADPAPRPVPVQACLAAAAHPGHAQHRHASRSGRAGGGGGQQERSGVAPETVQFDSLGAGNPTDLRRGARPGDAARL
jgi:hypothetical protein